MRYHFIGHLLVAPAALFHGAARGLDASFSWPVSAVGLFLPLVPVHGGLLRAPHRPLKPFLRVRPVAWFLPLFMSSSTIFLPRFRHLVIGHQFFNGATTCCLAQPTPALTNFLNKSSAGVKRIVREQNASNTARLWLRGRCMQADYFRDELQKAAQDSATVILKIF
jgi:hypothetical protein